MAVSTFLISGLGYFVTEKIVEPSLGKYNPNDADDPSVLDSRIERLSALEKKGLLWAGVSMLIFCLLLAWTIVPENGILRHPETGLVAGSPFLNGIVVTSAVNNGEKHLVDFIRQPDGKSLGILGQVT